MAGLKAVEIFSVGTWRGSKKVTVTSNMLDSMVTAFNALSPISGLRPPLKLGHTDEQKLMNGQRGGGPALGWVERIWREGDKIVADFSDVPDSILDLVRRKLYNHVSIEVFPTYEYEGNKFENVLTAVALLGAELPAVKGLKELSASLYDEAGVERVEFTEKEELEDMATFTQEQVDALVAAAVANEKTAFEAAHADAIKVAKEATEAAEKARDEFKEKAETAETALQTFREDTAKAEVTATIEKAVADGKITVAQKDTYTQMAAGLSAKVKFGDKEKSPAEVLKEIFDGMGKTVKLSEKGAGGKSDSESDAGDEVLRRAKDKVKSDNKLALTEAVKIVLEEDPALKQRYIAGE